MNMLNDEGNIYDTTFDVDSIPDEDIGPYLMRSPTTMEARTAGEAIDQEDFETEAKDETEEIVRGFILEKGIINEEHEKEKQEIIESLMKDREELIEKFKKQVMDIENKINKNEKDDYDKTKYGSSKSERRGVPLYVRLDRSNIISAEDFLSKLQLEDKFESEKDTLERSFRDEKRLLRDRLELECEKKMQLETRRFESTVEDLTRTIKELRLENSRFRKELKNRDLETKSKNAEMKSRWSNDKAKFEMEKYKIRDELERKYEKEMEAQSVGYEKILNDLKKDFKEVSRAMGKKEKEVSLALNNVKDYEEKVRKEMTVKMKGEYETLFDQLRHENKRLSEHVDKLKREKEILTGRFKELEDNNENRMNIVNEFTTRLNREYEERLKKTVLENESLKVKIEELIKENRIQEEALRDFRESTGRLEEELVLKKGLLAGCEESKEALRGEISDFSNEIDILRREKDELLKSVDDHSKVEKSLAEKMSKKELQADDAFDKCRISERERMNLERRLSLLSEELEGCLQEKEDLKNEIKKGDEDVFALKKLLDEERKEHDRFRERFRRDAEEIRRKENECRVLREQLRNTTDKIDQQLNKSAEKVDKLMELESENFELQKKLKGYETENGDLLRKEREEIQKQFAKEFAKRIHASKRSYEEAADGLKKQIRLLRSKVAELESLLVAKSLEGDVQHKHNEDALSPNQSRGLEISGFSQVESSSKVNQRDKYSEMKEASDNSTSLVRPFDYASNYKPNTTTSKTYGSTPAKDSALSPSVYKTQNKESRGRVYQGAFSRQRSRSVDSSNNRFEAGRAVHDFDDSRPRHKQTNNCGCSEESEWERISPPKSNLKLPSRYNERLAAQDRRYLGSEVSTIDNGDAVLIPTTYQDRYCEEVTGLPPKYKSNKQSPRSNKGANAQRWNGEANLSTERLEKSVEKLQERLEEGHNELLRRLEFMQNSVR